MQNNTFNAKRFGSYFATDIRTGFLSNGISFAVVAAIPLIAYILAGAFSLIIYGNWQSIAYPTRITMIFITAIIVLIIIPTKMYGNLTEKKLGTFWLMTPVSSLEKTVSMIVICTVIVPLAIFLSYGCIDALICLFDSRCGNPVLNMNPVLTLINDAGNHLRADGLEKAFLTLFNPLLYIDDIIQFPLYFLLGALIFKKNKVSKTILCIIALGIISSFITAPFFYNHCVGVSSSEDLSALFDRYGWIFNHLALVDTISDTIVNLALCIAIYFRVKTIKH